MKSVGLFILFLALLMSTLKSGFIQFQLCPIQIHRDTHPQSIQFKVKHTARSHELVKAINDSLEVSFKRTNVMMCAKIDDGKAILQTLTSEETMYDGFKVYDWIRTGQSLYIAVAGNCYATSDVLWKFEKKMNFMATHIVIHHNKIASKNDDDDQKCKELYTEEMSVNIKMKVSELKAQISKKYKIPSDELILRKAYHDEALRRDDRTLKSYGIHRNKVLFIERGKQKDSEFIFQIFIQNEMRQRYVLSGWTRENIQIRQIIPDTIFNLIFDYFYFQEADEPLTFVDNVILDRNWSMDKVKKVISKQCAGKLPQIKRMRIREFVNSRLTRLYFDDKTLGKNCGSSIRDYKQICVQRKWRKDEGDATKDHVLLNCVEFNPKTMTMGPLIEFMFLKKTKVLTEFKRELVDISGIDGDKLHFGMIFAHDFKAEKFPVFRNTNQINEKSTLGSHPWKCRQGDIIMYFGRNY